MAEGRDHYVVGALVQGWTVLAAFREAGELLRLRDVVSRTGLRKGTVFRILYTLHQLGLIEKTGNNQYRRLTMLPTKKKYRLGYARNGPDAGFTRVVTGSLLQAAQRADLELLTLDNRNDRATTLRNAESLVRERVDLAVEFQGDESISDALSATIRNAGIPLIAVDIPHPGATYFGANNYEAGLIAGRHMGRWARVHWQGRIDELLIIEFRQAGSLPRARKTGLLAGLSEAFRGSEIGPTVELDGHGAFGPSLEVVRRYLRSVPAKRTLVGSVNDTGALAALRAFEEAGRASFCAVMGQNAEPDARVEMRQPNTRLIGSVAYFPEKYGEGIIKLALNILGGKQVPPAVFTRHLLVTPDNVDHLYPNDALF